MASVSDCFRDLVHAERCKLLELQGSKVVKALREAEIIGYTIEDVYVALNSGCSFENSVQWLRDNLQKTAEDVAAKASVDENINIGKISCEEAILALRKCKGDKLAAIKQCAIKRAECVKALEKYDLFKLELIVKALASNNGRLEEALFELNKSALRSFFNRLVTRDVNSEFRSGGKQTSMADAESRKLEDEDHEDSSEESEIFLSCESDPNNNYQSDVDVAVEVTEMSTDSFVDGREVLLNEIVPTQSAVALKRNGGKSENENFERNVRKLLAQRKVSSYAIAEVAVKLIQMEYSEQDAVYAAEECKELDVAHRFLADEQCEICLRTLLKYKMIGMLSCTHFCCKECTVQYFTTVIQGQSILKATCPICSLPDLKNDVSNLYFSNLNILLKDLLEPKVYELYQKKLLDKALRLDQNFVWCPKCHSGFFSYAVHVDGFLFCPDCNAVLCVKCNQIWEERHLGVPCDEFNRWKDSNDLEKNGIDCPNCKLKYLLVKGGCMHCKCTQCQFEFCSGCKRPFKTSQECSLMSQCPNLGLHAHHPRNCLFYLRDRDPEDLQTLLKTHNIKYDTQILPSGESTDSNSNIQRRCPILEQKETPTGHIDANCTNEVVENYAGFCRIHYIEYLVGLVNENKIDPIELFNTVDLEQEIIRRGKSVPARQNEDDYNSILIKFIQSEIQLEDLGLVMTSG